MKSFEMQKFSEEIMDVVSQAAGKRLLQSLELVHAERIKPKQDALREFVNPDNWGCMTLDGTDVIYWNGDPDVTPLAIAETGLGGPVKR